VREREAERRGARRARQPPPCRAQQILLAASITFVELNGIT